jgi:hypothetical protein
MASSGTWNFSLDLADIMEEAYERCGDELRTGYDYLTARRSLNLLLLEWSNKGLTLWKVKNASEALVQGQVAYPLSAEKLDIIEGLLRTDEGDITQQTDLSMKRESISNYARQTNKLTQGRPTQFWVERSVNQITVNVWPVPDGRRDYVFNYYYVERIEDAGKPASLTIDVDDRYLPALTAGLAYYVSMKKAPDRTAGLKGIYEEAWTLASDAARNKASFFMKPGGNYHRV